MKLHSEDSPMATALKALVTPSYLKGHALQRLREVGPAPQDNFEHGNNASTLLMVHGICSLPRTMKELGDFLRDKHNVAYAPIFSRWNTDDIRVSAEKLREKIEQIFRDHEKNEDLTIIGHSTGGLIGLETQRNIQDVAGLVALATPFRGTPQARVGSFLRMGEMVQQVSPDSEFLRSLNEIFLQDVSVTCHVSEEDNVVPPLNQTPSITTPLQLEVVHHDHFQHFDFIVGKKARQFAKELMETFRVED